jgi:hypothetical protein
MLLMARRTARRGATHIRSISSLSSWWKDFRRELREELTVQPDPPGTVNTSLFDPEKWERLSPEQIRVAMLAALWMSWVDWKSLFDFLMGRPFSLLPPDDEGEKKAAATDAAQSAPGVSLPSVTSEQARAAALHVVKRLSAATQDEDLKSRLAAIATEVLSLARDCLDEFLLGYQVSADRPAHSVARA